MHTILSTSTILVVVLQVVGGCYLFYLAQRIWRSATVPLALNASSAIRAKNDNDRRVFAKALGTMLSNPKAAVQYGVIFAALLPSKLTLDLSIRVVAAVFALEAGWYLIVALVLSSSAPRTAYLSRKTGIDRAAATVMALLGLRLLVAAFEAT